MPRSRRRARLAPRAATTRSSLSRSSAASVIGTSLAIAVPGPVLPQVRVDEGLQVAVHHLLHVGHLELGTMVVDHGVGLEHARADLAAEGDVRLGVLQLGLFLLLL